MSRHAGFAEEQRRSGRTDLLPHVLQQELRAADPAVRCGPEGAQHRAHQVGRREEELSALRRRRVLRRGDLLEGEELPQEVCHVHHLRATADL